MSIDRQPAAAASMIGEVVPPYRRRLWFIVFLGVFTGVLCALTMRLINGSRPHLVMQTEMIDIGRVPPATTHRVTFPLMNGGSVPLRVAIDSVSCNCTGVRLPKNELAPGEKLDCVAYITSAAGEGQFGSDILVSSNDPSRSRAKLRIRGQAAAAVVCKPQSLYFGSVPLQELPVSKSFRIVPGQLGSSATVDNIRITADDESLGVDCRKDNGDLLVTVSLPSATPIGFLRAKLRVELQQPVAHVLVVPIAAEITGKYQVMPSALAFGRVTEDSPVVRQCRIEGLSDIERMDVKYDDSLKDRLSVVVDRDGHGAVVVATMKTSSSKLAVDSELKIALVATDGRVEHLVIPVIARF